MEVSKTLQSLGLTQITLAKIIAGAGEVDNRIRVRAHRIWNGQKPSDDEMQLIYADTDGRVTANVWYGIPSYQKPKKQKT